MTPLKAASRAYVNAGSEYHGKPNDKIYDAFSKKDQAEADDAMRAALMALAEAELPSEAMVDGGEAIDSNFGMTDTSRAELAFRAMLRSICHADTEQAEKSVSAVPASSNEDGETR